MPKTDINYRVLLTKYMERVYKQSGMLFIPGPASDPDAGWLEQEINDLKMRAKHVIRRCDAEG